jgi:hypothetical protein
LRRHYEIQNVFTKSQNQIDFVIKHARVVLDMQRSRTHNQIDVLKKHVSFVLFNCKLFFLNSQMNETAFMLQCTFDRISLVLELENNQVAVNVVKKLKSVQTFDEIIVDTMNLNKTYFALLFLNYMIVHCQFDDMHRFILILAFNEVMLCQWMNVIRNHFFDLKLIVAHDEKSKSRNAKSWINFLIMKKVLQKLIHWFQKFINIFDINDKMTFKTIVLSTYDIFANRIVNTIVEKRLRKNDKKKYVSKWAKRFNIVILNEDHKFRHSWIKIYAFVRELHVKIHWFFTIILIMNSVFVNVFFISVWRSHVINCLKHIENLNVFVITDKNIHESKCTNDKMTTICRRIISRFYIDKENVEHEQMQTSCDEFEEKNRSYRIKNVSLTVF